jgi:hypothetical protein
VVAAIVARPVSVGHRIAGRPLSWTNCGPGFPHSCPARLTETIELIRWRLWHRQLKRALDLIAETVVTVDIAADNKSPIAAAARKVARLLGDLETYVSGQSDIIIDYATARRCEEPISTAITESTVQWLLHRRMNAHQQMRWFPRGAHLMLKVRTSS